MVLNDLQVLDLTIARAGPTAVRQLADWGASVLRVESPAGRDSLTGKHEGPDYLNLHRNKRLVTLDLKSERGLEVFYRMVEGADVVVENFRPPVKRRLKVDYERLAEINPRIIYGSISGFGQDGPYAERGAVDQIIQGLGGLMSITGEPGSVPTRTGIAISDLAAGHQLAIGLLVALHERNRSGRGQWVQVNLLQALIAFLDFQAAKWTVAGEVASQTGNHHPSGAPMGTYRAADGYMNLAASTQPLWERFCRAVGADELIDVPEFATSGERVTNRELLNEQLEGILAERPVDAWVTLLNEAGVPSGPINSVDDVFADPQVRHLGVTASVDHPTCGDVEVLRSPVTMSRSSSQEPTPAPLPGQHTDEALRELGLTSAEIEDLRREGAI